MPQVVAQHQLRALVTLGRRVHAGLSLHLPAALEVRPGNERPEPFDRLLRRLEDGTLETHRVVVARRNMTRRVHVVDQVYAAEKSHPAVNRHEFAVHPAQTVIEPAKRNVRTKKKQPHPGTVQLFAQNLWHVLATEAVDHHMYRHAAPRCTAKRIGDAT